MSTFETEHAQLGQVAQMVDELHAIVAELRKANEYGAAGDLEIVAWDPAKTSGPTGEFTYDGSFAAVGIFNLSAGVMRVSLTPNGAAAAGREMFTLSARGFIVLPYRGNTVSVGGAAAGSALIVPCAVSQPLNAGVF